MSPTEDELRAALSDGQGPGPDADLVISRALAARRERRVRYGSIAAVVAVVAGIGVGAGVALNGRHHNPTNSTDLAGKTPVSGQAAQAPRPSADGPFSQTEPQAAAKDGAAGTACPATLPSLTVPNTGSGSLFDGTVSSITICVYPEAGGPAIQSGGHPVSTVLGGTDATGLVASLDGASATKQTEPCPLYLSPQGKMLLILAGRPDGTLMSSIEAHVLQNPCNLPVTNGKAVRYNWTPPASLTSLLGAVSSTSPTPGVESGSPARS